MVVVSNAADKSSKMRIKYLAAGWKFVVYHNRQQDIFCSIATLETRLVQVKEEVSRQELSDLLRTPSMFLNRNGRRETR